MFWLSNFLLSVSGWREKKWIVSVQDAKAFFETMYLYDSWWLHLETIDDKQTLKKKIECIREDDFWLFTKENRDTVKQYIETYANKAILLQQIDDIERKKHKLYAFLEKIKKQFHDIPVDLIQEKLKTINTESPFNDVYFYLIQWHCLESQFFRDSIDPSDPLHNKNTYKHLEFQVRLLMQELWGMLFDIEEKALKEQVEWLLELLWDWRFDSQRPHEDAFFDLQKEMAHVTKQWLLLSLE